MSCEDEPSPDSFRRGLQGLLDERARRHSASHKEIATSNIVAAVEQEIDRKLSSANTEYARLELAFGRTLRALELFRERHPEMASALDRALEEAFEPGSKEAGGGDEP